ncbi:MAG: HK97 family phage prohead protease [Clostridia bacterium]|nr:HK97 family phage prohead protease [Clostridia bacterium]
MAKEVVISTSGLNCYGSRVLTSGIDLTQFQKNPVLLWMHRRSYNGRDMPIGRMENLRIDGDRLIGTPVFDENDEFAKQIANKWENGFLRMASAGIEIVETSDAPEHLLQGQTRATITRCKLEEVSIVDIGGNDEALQLYGTDGKLMTLASGEDCDHLPLLLDKKHAEGTAPEASFNNQNNNNSMNKEILQLLGLSETASEQEAVSALRLLKEKADKAESLQLASINALVDGAVADKRITADKKEHFVNLGKSVGVESLRTTLELMQPQHKPTEVIHQTADQPAGGEHKTYAKLSDVPATEIPSLKESNPTEYARLYKAEYGVEV